MTNERLRILLPEGSSLSARQALTALGPLGYMIDVCDADEFCICRFSCFTHKYSKTPVINENPLDYMKVIKKIVQETPYDVLIPNHENAYLFAKAYDELSQFVRIPLAKFQSFERVQSKAEFMRLLDELKLPHPATAYVRSVDDLCSHTQFPSYIKAAFGTAGNGTWRVSCSSELHNVVQKLEDQCVFRDNGEVIVQAVAPGTLCVAQSVFDNGNLLNVHSYEQKKAGIGGSASARVSVHHPMVKNDLARIGEKLHWHGSLMVDYLYDPLQNSVSYIEANPRPGETMNATLSGINFVRMLVDLALGKKQIPVEAQKYGVATHSALAVLLGKADQTSSRLAILKEIWKITFKVGEYRESREDLTPILEDWPSLIPLLVVLITLLIQPRRVHQLSAKAIQRYSLDARAVSFINANV